MLLLWAVLGCGDTPVDPAAADTSMKVPEEKIDSDLAKAEAKIEKKVSLPTLAETTTPEIFSKKWLVIIQSSKESGTLPDTWGKLHDGIENVAPARLKSGYYKNLMPCWEIVVANQFSEKKSAIALSKTLKDSGIDNYVKNAGSFVGKDSRIDAMCAKADQTTKTSSYLIGVSVQGHVQVPITAAEIHRKRIVEGHEKKLKSLTESVWYTGIPTQHVGDHKKGDGYTIIDLEGKGEAQKCTVQGFSLIVRGTPHFSIQNPKKPTCGETQIFAQLDCKSSDLERPYLIIPASKKVPDVVRVVGKSLETDAFSKDKMLEKEYKKAQKEAKEQGETLKSQFSKRQLQSLDGKTVGSVKTVQYLSNEGNSYCGGEDINVKYSAMFNRTERISTFMETTERDILGIINPLSENPLIIHRDWPSVLSITDFQEKAEFSLRKDFCDCSC